MKKIGENFENELRAAGLFGMPFSWGEDGVFQFDERMTAEHIDAVNAVLAAHNPAVLPAKRGARTKEEIFADIAALTAEVQGLP